MIAEYEKLDGLGIADLVRSGEVHASEILETAIRLYEERNPILNAIVVPLFEEARRAVQQNIPDGPFSGVPYAFKELVVSVLGAPATFASKLYQNNWPERESEIVTRCRQAGMVVLGKTNSSEFGLSPVTEPSLFGPTRNPWDLSLSPGGSSGGAAAAVAAGILPVAHATDGGGSIRIPASCCGLFGLKPTRARITAGPETGEGLGGFASQHAVSRSVRDSAALLDSTSGPLPGDPYFPPAPKKSYLEESEAEPGRLRIAYSTSAPNGAPIAPECADAVISAARLCEELGHAVEEDAPSFSIDDVQKGFLTVFQAHTMANIARKTGGSLPKPEEVEPLTLALAERGRAVSAAEYIRTLHMLHAQARQIAKFYLRYDIWLTPTLATPPPRLGQFSTDQDNVERWFSELMAFIPFTFLCNVTGQPAMSVPLGRGDRNIPIGCHFSARYGEEALLFNLAGQLERAHPWKDIRPDFAAK